MPIYTQKDKKLIPIREKKIDLERTIQGMVEQNLTEVFGLTFVSSEFALNSLRVDTLAFDEEQKSFVIIEYKKDRSFSVIDQGYAYLALMLNNKADFILEYNEKCKKNLRKDDVDWSQSRVVFIASSFTKYQQEALGFQDLPISLWEIKAYDNDLILFTELRPSEKSESVKTIAKGTPVELVTREIKLYTLNDHFKPDWTASRALFELFTQRAMELEPKFEIRPRKYYIGFNLNNKVVFDISSRNTWLKLGLYRVRPEDLRDPEKKAYYRTNSFESFNKHITHFDIKNEDDVDYAMMLVRQVYKKFIE